MTCVFGADDGIRTRDPNLGKVVLYQLSHVRVEPATIAGAIWFPPTPTRGGIELVGVEPLRVQDVTDATPRWAVGYLRYKSDRSG